MAPPPLSCRAPQVLRNQDGDEGDEGDEAPEIATEIAEATSREPEVLVA